MKRHRMRASQNIVDVRGRQQMPVKADVTDVDPWPRRSADAEAKGYELFDIERPLPSRPIRPKRSGHTVRPDATDVSRKRGLSAAIDRVLRRR